MWSMTGNDRIVKYGPDGAVLTTWGSAGTGDGQFVEADGAVVDSEGNVYVSDNVRNDIQVFDEDGDLPARSGAASAARTASSQGVRR